MLGIGQAAGATAAIAHSQNKKPKQINIRELQSSLLSANVWLMPFMDITPQSPFFDAVQKVCLAGWMRGEGIPVVWTNETRFYPDQPITANDYFESISRIKQQEIGLNMQPVITRDIFAELIWKEFNEIISSGNNDPPFTNIEPSSDIEKALSFLHSQAPEFDWFSESTFNLKAPVLRKEAAFWFDRLFKPFESPLYADDVVIED